MKFRLLFTFYLIILGFLNISYCNFQNESSRAGDCSQNVHITSSTRSIGAALEAYINNQQISMSNTAGIHIVVISNGSKQIIQYNQWDLQNAGLEQDLIDFINNIRKNDIVLLGIHTNANQLTSNGYTALEKIGYPQNRILSQDEVVVLIGQKGKNETQEISFTISGQVTQSKCIEECSPLCWSCPENGPDNCTQCETSHDHFSQYRQDSPPECQPLLGRYEDTRQSIETNEVNFACENFVSVSVYGYNSKSGNHIRMYRNNVRLSLPVNANSKIHSLGRERIRGIYLAVFETTSQNLEEITYYDTGFVQADVQKLINYIDGIVDGKYVALGMTGQATQYLNQALFDKLQEIGAKKDLVLAENDTFALVGIKGSESGSAEQFKNQGEQEGEVQARGCLGCKDASRSGVNCDCQPGFYNFQDKQTCKAKPDDCFMWVSSDSRGFDDGMFFQINILNKRVEFQNWELGPTQGRGMCILETNDYAQQIYRQCFDLHGTIAENIRMRDYLNSRPIGTLMIFTVKDESTKELQTYTTNAIRNFGLPSDWDLSYGYDSQYYRGTFAAIGRKGSAAGTAEHQQKLSGNGMSHVETCLIECEPKCAKCINAKGMCETCDNTDSNRDQTPPLCPCKPGYKEDFNTQLCVTDNSVCYSRAQIISAGSADGQDAFIYLNGQQIQFAYNDQDNQVRQGIYIVEINSQSFQKDDEKSFDIKNGETQQFIDYINALQNDQIILLAFANQVYDTLDSNSKLALESIGMASSTNIQTGCSFALIGQKGMNPGEAQQVMKNPYDGQAKTEKCLQKCHPKCTDCTTDSNTCTTCNGSATREGSTPCDCLDAFYEPNLADCLNCDNICATCDKPGTCLTCKAGRDINNSCACYTGFIENSSTGECECPTNNYVDNNKCLPCAYPCQACTSASVCTTCARQNGVPSTCDCPAVGYYKDSNDDCQILVCQDKCNTCNHPSSCQTCKSGRDINDDCNCLTNYVENTNTQVCECPSGFYLNGADCLDCPYPCQECSTASQCTSCERLNAVTPNCDCPAGYYLDSNDDCQNLICQNKCSTCSLPSSCDTCKSGRDSTDDCNCKTNYIENTNTWECDCPAGYFVDSSGDCIKCQAPCDECTSLSQCSTCSRAGGIGPNCDCPQGNYIDSNDDCAVLVCQNKCDTCNQPSSCQTCKAGRDINDDCNCYKNFVENSSTGECECPSGFFLNAPNDCQDCPYPCQNCDSASVCTSCERKGAVLPSCNCPPGHYLDQNDDCQKLVCDEKCDTCNNPNSCLTCKAGRDINNDCQCYNNYQNNVQTGECECPSGFYLSTANQNECLECQYPCNECSAQNICTSCDRVGGQGPNCECPTGQVLDQNDDCYTPIDCDIKCLSCENTSNNCTKCRSGLGRDENLPCECLDGYYEIQGQVHCQQCKQECKTCSDSKTCLTCSNPLFTAPECNSKEPKYELKLNNEVLFAVCNLQCEACTEKNVCTSCQPGLYRTDQIPDCNCQIGYHAEDNSQIDCLECQPQCLECENSYSCSKCDKKLFRELNINNLQCECMIGYKENSNKECQKCYLFNDDCLFECPESTVQDEQNQTCEDVVYQVKQNFQVFAILGLMLGTCFLIQWIVTKLATQQNYKKPIHYEQQNQIQYQYQKEHNSTNSDLEVQQIE